MLFLLKQFLIEMMTTLKTQALEKKKYIYRCISTYIA